MEKVELPFHKHPLLPITRLTRDTCNGCGFTFKIYPHDDYIYGGYRCNELGCGSVFHRECAESLPEINHSSHPDHPLKLLLSTNGGSAFCSRCGDRFENGYICSICDYKLDLRCANGTGPLLVLENSNLHEHPLELFNEEGGVTRFLRKSNWYIEKTATTFLRKSNSYIEETVVTDLRKCNWCDSKFSKEQLCYICNLCDIFFHGECVEFSPEANHTSHPQHPLKLLALKAAPPDYADETCLLCGIKFDYNKNKLHHCDVCNFSICTPCMKQPPPVRVESLTTHEHQLHLVPRRIYFTCNACGTLGDRSPYFCLQCNFMIHRQCIDLPRVININRHDHRISYTRRLGHHGEWNNCKVCRKKVDGFYGAYTCKKCPSFGVHSLCATRDNVWDLVELEGMPEEEEEIPPFKVIDGYTIKHFSHDHNLIRINEDGHDRILHDNIVCEACVLQIISEPFYSCEQCDFILHEKCANHPRKKRHVSSNLPFTLLTDSRDKVDHCWICYKRFTGFRYKAGNKIIDVRCAAAVSDTLEHGSHQHTLYFDSTIFTTGYLNSTSKGCSRCGEKSSYIYSCDECDYSLDAECAQIPKKVMRDRYDDHPLILSFGEKNVDGDYWCEACETKVNPKEWFYTCNDCGTVLHISCVVGRFSYIMPGSHPSSADEEVVSNTSVCRPVCYVCNSQCRLPSVLKLSKAGVDAYFCSFKCLNKLRASFN